MVVINIATAHFLFLTYPAGLVGDLQHGIAEIGWANLYITPARGKVIDYSDWYTVEEFCFLFKKPDPFSGMHTLIFPLHEYVWLSMFVSLAAVGCYYLLQSLAWHPGHISFSNLLLYEASVVFKESHRYSHRYYTQEFRYIFGGIQLLDEILAEKNRHCLFFFLAG